MGELYLHVKRGSIYKTIMETKMKCGGHWIEAMLYIDPDGKLWVRSKEEFFDGRFKLMREYEDRYL